MSWGMLEDLMKDVNHYSTPAGRIWLSVLFLFRLMVLIVSAEEVWSDEQNEFECNTEQPGCESICYNYFFPLSHVRFWALQLLLVTTPTLLVLMHVASRRMRVARQKFPSGREIKLEGGLLWTYTLSVIAKILVESGGVVLFKMTYGDFVLPHYVSCETFPCPNSVVCFISRPTEKNIFILFMLTVSTICLLLNVAELAYLSIRICTQGRWKVGHVGFDVAEQGSSKRRRSTDKKEEAVTSEKEFNDSSK
uniref:gap junction beta-2 protein-like n=1 Tax=Myxine glutinosa TaxID=7769 RepID=UPI00358F8A47